MSMIVSSQSPTSLSEAAATLESIRKEHAKLALEMAEAKHFTLHKETEMKQLQDHRDFLAKEHKRIQEWDKQVAERENAVKHYVLNAETGVISGNLQ